MLISLFLTTQNLWAFGFLDRLLYPTEKISSSSVEITLSPNQFAGAIESLKWNNKEFVNIFDHGRQIQSAIQIDGFGECFNPTEAGSAHDGYSRKGSSKVTSIIKKSEQLLEVQTQMAQWSYQKTTGACKKGLSPIANTALSNHYLNKKIELNFNNDPQLIKVSLQFSSPQLEVSKNILYEFLTGYLNSEFDQFYIVKNKELLRPEKFNDISGNGFPAGSYQAGSRTPIIQADLSGKYAMGIYFPQSQIDGCGGQFHGYVMYKFNLGGTGPKGNATNKWSLAYNQSVRSKCFKTENGYLTRQFDVYLAVGDLQTVFEKIQKLEDLSL